MLELVLKCLEKKYRFKLSKKVKYCPLYVLGGSSEVIGGPRAHIGASAELQAVSLLIPTLSFSVEIATLQEGVSVYWSVTNCCNLLAIYWLCFLLKSSVVQRRETLLFKHSAISQKTAAVFQDIVSSLNYSDRITDKMYEQGYEITDSTTRLFVRLPRWHDCINQDF